MSEDELALLVAKTVAEYNDNKTWLQELASNVETIVVLFLAAVGGIGALARRLYNMDKRMALMEGYKDTHDQEDREAHSRLEQSNNDVLQELRIFRGELKDSSERGDEGRRSLHERLDKTNKEVQEVSKSLHRLIGFHEGAHQQPSA